MAVSREEFDKLIARQEELAHQMRALSEEMHAFAAMLSMPESPIKPVRRPIDAETPEEILAHFDALREKTRQGQVFANSTDIVRQFREDRDSFGE